MQRFSPLDLIRARSWTSAFFTTFSLSLAHFEAVILDALMRQNVRQNLILADVVGVRSALTEYGARHAGRSYQIEPVAVEAGCFHPKLMALTAPDDAHLVIGSGNVTVGGWGANLECSEHLHSSFAPDAVDDVAEFLEKLAVSNLARHAAGEACARLARNLRRLNSAPTRTGNIRVVTTLERPIVEQLVDIADDLGGAHRLAIASPFFDDGTAIDRLCIGLGLNEVSIHAHSSGVVTSAMGTCWPERPKTRVSAVAIEPLTDDGRRLHAKVFEVLCRRGRILMSGSANATMAGLMQGRNVELSVVRIQRTPAIGWRLTASSPLDPSFGAAANDEACDQAGILRAEFHGDKLHGEIVTPFPIGDAAVLQLTDSGPKELATTAISDEGRFALPVPGLDVEGWQAKRLVIRVRSASGNRIAEGFVFFPDVAEITRRAGAIAPRLLAILAGTETPADVAAVMTWFFEHPENLQMRFSGGGGETSPDHPETYARVADLLNPLPQVADDAGGDGDAGAGAGWQRFMDQIFASFRAPRGTATLATETPDTISDEGDPLPDEPPPEIDEAMAAFDRLFDLLLGEAGGRRDLGVAIQISQYVCDRLLPSEEIVEGYLGRLMRALSSAEVLEDDRMHFAAAILVSAARQKRHGHDSAALRIARRHLLRLSVDVAGEMPDMDAVRGFARILTPEVDFSALWDAIRGVRTFQEEVRLFRQAGPGPLKATSFPALATRPEWAQLAVLTPATRAKIIFLDQYTDVCPCRRHLGLPAGEAAALKAYGVARAGNCCGALLMCEEV